jgi:hypothetical protein
MFYLVLITVCVSVVIFGIPGTLSHLVAQRTTCDSACSSTKGSDKGAYDAANYSTSYSSGGFASISVSDVVHYTTSIVILASVPGPAFIVFSHSSHFLVI